MSKTRIIEAVRKLDLESIKKLLDDNPSLLSVTDRMGRNLLHLACSAQCKELNVPESVSARVVTFLLNRGLDVESPLVTSDGCDTVNAVCEFHISNMGQKLTRDASASRGIFGVETCSYRDRDAGPPVEPQTLMTRGLIR